MEKLHSINSLGMKKLWRGREIHLNIWEKDNDLSKSTQ